MRGSIACARPCTRRGSTRSLSTPTTRAPPACPGSRASSRIGRKRCWSCRATARRIWSRRSVSASNPGSSGSAGSAKCCTRRAIGLKAAQQIAAKQTNAAVGVVDFDGLAAGIAADLGEGGPSLALQRRRARCSQTLRAKADPADIALAEKACSDRPSRTLRARDETLNAMIAVVESAARELGAEEIYIAAAPDLARDMRPFRIEGEAALGKTSHCAPPSPTRARGCAWCARFASVDTARGARTLCASGGVIADRSRLCRLSPPGWSKVAGWRSRWSR